MIKYMLVLWHNIFRHTKQKEYEKINRKLTKEEWKKIENYIEKLEIENGYMQELGEHEEEYVPKWDI